MKCCVYLTSCLCWLCNSKQSSLTFVWITESITRKFTVAGEKDFDDRYRHIHHSPLKSYSLAHTERISSLLWNCLPASSIGPLASSDRAVHKLQAENASKISRCIPCKFAFGRLGFKCTCCGTESEKFWRICRRRKIRFCIFLCLVARTMSKNSWALWWSGKCIWSSRWCGHCKSERIRGNQACDKVLGW